MLHRRKIVLCAGLLAFAAGIAVIFLIPTDWRPRIENFASREFGRPITIQSVTVGWGNPIALDMTGLHVANSPWGSIPDMISVDHVHADIALWPLLRGLFRLDRVTIERPAIVLERDGDGVGNWILVPQGASSKDGATSFVQFIGAMKLSDGTLTFRTTQHNILRMHVIEADLRAADDNAPVVVDAHGTYNDLPIQTTVTFESFAALRQVPRPVATELIGTSKHTSIKLVGTMTDPIRFDGIKAKVDLAAETLEELSGVIGTDEFTKTGLTVSGTLGRQGDRWLWTDLRGLFDSASISGMLGLDEGSRGWTSGRSTWSALVGATRPDSGTGSSHYM